MYGYVFTNLDSICIKTIKQEMKTSIFKEQLHNARPWFHSFEFFLILLFYQAMVFLEQSSTELI